MQQFQFAQILQMKRQQLKLTQEEIANFVGVTRAAVSKWEKGLSYPDITLLPKLATYFNLSIDTLLGYEPQMTKENIDKLYAKFALRLASEPFEQVEADLKKVVKEYFSCFPLLMRIIQLYMNYYKNALDPIAALNRAIHIVEHIKNTSTEISVQNEANILEAFIHLLQGNAEQVLELLGTEPKIEQGNDQIIATAHAMQGNIDMAKEVLQVSMYQQLLGIISNGTELLLHEVNNPKQYDETIAKTETIIKLFRLENLQINSFLVFYLKASIGYMMMQKDDQALNMMENYVFACEKLKFPLEFHGDDYFYKVKNWIKRQPQISTQAPRDEQSIKKDILGAFSQNPVFAPLYEHPKFKQYIKRLQLILKMEGENEK